MTHYCTLAIDWNKLSVFDMNYILSNSNGYIDGDKHTVIIKGRRR